MLKKLLLSAVVVSVLGVCVWREAVRSTAVVAFGSGPVPVCPPEGPCPK